MYFEDDAYAEIDNDLDDMDLGQYITHDDFGYRFED